MRKLTATSAGLALVLAMIALPVHAVEDGSSAEPSEPAESAAIEWLFVQNAGSGSLEPAADGTYQLVLNAMDEDTIAFTDTPHRKVESLSTSEVATAISAASEKPNAALQVESPSPLTVVLELVAAHYDQGAGTMTYAARLLADGSLGDLIAEGELPDGAFSDPTLFIDGEKVADSSTDWLDFEVGSTCIAGDDPSHPLDATHCWQVEHGGPNWPSSASSISVTFKNNGTKEVNLQSGAPIFGCGTGHDIDPGQSRTLTFHHKNNICVSAWASTEIANPIEIVTIQPND